MKNNIVNDKRLRLLNSIIDLKLLSIDQLDNLAITIRDDIVKSTAKNGGHVGASLGCVDFIIALHYVFDCPIDDIVFDVGHQAYAHKMLTGRRFQFNSLRQEGSTSGYLSPQESVCDAFGAGHASTSLSAALGIIEAKQKKGDNSHVVAIIGDGSIGGGMALEALNHLGELQSKLIIVLNDNQISIDKSVGGLQKSFADIDSEATKKFFNSLKINYWGSFNGHDIHNLISVFNNAKKTQAPLLIHLQTEKGRGYAPAIKNKTIFHGCSPFSIETGEIICTNNNSQNYQDVFADKLIELANFDKSIIAITAAMPTGTSLNKFKQHHPDKFYDVGIAEEHAVTFAAGLAKKGLKPFVCIYSTFLQRAYDQLLHDVALQKLPVRFCLDRAGVVGSDGKTHQGLFDYTYLKNMPNFTIMAPHNGSELIHMMETMTSYKEGPISMRFPRGICKEWQKMPSHLNPDVIIGKAQRVYGPNHGDILILAIGHPVNSAIKAAKKICESTQLQVGVVNLRFAKPLDEELITSLAPQFKSVITVEEGMISGGVGSSVLELLADNNIMVAFCRLGAPDIFINHATQNKQREQISVDYISIATTCLKLINEASSLKEKELRHNNTL